MKNIPSSSLKELDYDQDEESVTLSLSTMAPSSHVQTPPQNVPPSISSSKLPQQPTWLTLSPPPRPPQKSLVLPPPPHLTNILLQPPTSHQDAAAGPSRLSRTRRSPVRSLGPGKSDTIAAPYPWATTKRATVHSLDHLMSNGINNISGEVQCKRCDEQYEIEFDLEKKFMEVATFISKNKHLMHDRAPTIWMNPVLPDCSSCGQNNCVKPILSKKKSINWLFLLLGQMLGCCKLAELKYFCKHTKNHRTGAKDRVLYLTYFELCKQLVPDEPL
ncbi:uncharacterized protein LOC132314661 [Cornus florida]|uniref:uncharacterized protein LOC132314661 n=1 Tax=Cornus florida TaxID=4283 RepID=UPI00289A0998|nr:uncharacterized protein LOC132314661 [Cornus florida]